MLPDWTSFFYVLPLLAPGGIINPPPKTACRDQAHFRRDPVKISTRLHFSVRAHSPFSFFFAPSITRVSFFSSFNLPLGPCRPTYRHEIKYLRTVDRTDVSYLARAKSSLHSNLRCYSSLIETFKSEAEAFVQWVFLEINETLTFVQFPFALPRNTEERN